MSPARSEWDPRRGREGREWERIKREVCPPGSLCAMPVCKMSNRVIVFGLRHNHPLGPSVDHIIRITDGGHPTARWNLRPAHFGCNSSRWMGSLPVRKRSRAWPI